MPDKTALICECSGEISRKVPLEQIRCFLEKEHAGLKVVTADSLCQYRVLANKVKEEGLDIAVIGACTLLKEKVGNLLFDDSTVRVVELLEETKELYSDTEIEERSKLLLMSQVNAYDVGVSVPERARKLQISGAGEEITRRQLFELPIPKYITIPYIELPKCIGRDRCNNWGYIMCRGG